jgi:uncharacterized protein YggE
MAMSFPIRIAAPLLLALLLPCAAGAQRHDGDERTITVHGEGRALAEPDLATVHLGVTTDADSAAAALESNNKAMSQLFRTLTDAGIDSKDLQTSNFSISPQYERDERGRRQPQVIGYEVRNQVRIKVRDLSNVGAILDQAVGSGANQIHGIQFSVDDPSKVMDEARREAVKDAQRRAQLYAKAADVELGRLQSLNETSASIPQPRNLQFARLAAAEAVPIASGQEAFHIQITARFAIAPGEKK